MRQKTRLFISYSRKDAVFVDRLEAALKELGFETLIDRAEIYAFEDWWRRLQDLIIKADTLLFVVSPDSIASDVCQKEIDFACSLNKRIAPIVYRHADVAAMPTDLARFNFIYLDDETRFHSGLAYLSEALVSNIDWIRKHTDISEQARRWSPEGEPGPNGLLLRSPALDEAERWIAMRPEGAPLPTPLMQRFIAESRRTTTRRRMLAMSALAFGLIVSVGTLALALWQSNVANEQLRVAELELERSGKNAKIAGEHLDQLIVSHRRNIELLQRRSETNPRDQGPKGELAFAFGQLGDALWKRRNADGALSAFRESLMIANAVGATEASETRWPALEAMALVRIGDILLAKGDRPAALSAYQKCITIRRNLVARNAGNTQWQIELVNAMMGSVQAGDDARLRFREALDLMRRVRSAGKADAKMIISIEQLEVELGKLDAANR